MTLLFGGVIFLAYSIIQGMAMIPMLFLERGGPGGFTPPPPGTFPFSGFNLAIGTSVGCPAMLTMCGLIILARRGPTLARYLALQPIRLPSLLGWIALMEVIAIGLSSLNDLVQRPPPEFIATTYASAGHLPFFWAAIALCAPVGEEVFFRGFLFPGLLQSRLRTAGTLALTSFAFMVVHGGQYEWADLLQIGVVGLALGLARIRTGSILAPIAMHVALNLTSLILYALHLEG